MLHTIVLLRVHQTVGSYSAQQLCAVLLALGRCRLRLSKAVYDSFVQHLAARSEDVPAQCATDLVSALQATMPSQLQGTCPSEHYQQLHARLTATPQPVHHGLLMQPSGMRLPAAANIDHLELTTLCTGANGSTHHLPCSSGGSNRISAQLVEEKQLVTTTDSR